MKKLAILTLFLFLLIGEVSIAQTLRVTSTVSGAIDPVIGETIWEKEVKSGDMYFSLDPEKNKIMIFSSKGCKEMMMIDYPGETKDIDNDLYQIELLLVDINTRDEHIGAIICDKSNKQYRGFILYTLNIENPESSIYFFE